MSFNGSNVMTRAAALRQLLDCWRPQAATETLPLTQASGRVLAADLCSCRTLPVGRSAKADGIAVRAADFAEGRPNTFLWQLGRDYAMADTGDDFPDAFDTVIRIEDLRFTEADKFFIHRQAQIQPGQLINGRGSHLEEGEALLSAGTRLNALGLNLLTAAGYTEAPVLRRPRVAFLPTGSELLPPGALPNRGENIDSNSVMIASLLREWGAEPLLYPIIKDIRADLQTAIDQALAEADIVLVNGGSSKGSEDYNAHLIQAQASWSQHGIASVPGMPVLLALAQGKPLLNLPGPPFAAFTVMDWCVRPLVYAAQGQTPPPPATVRARLTAAAGKPPGLEFYLRLHLYQENGCWLAEPLTMGRRFGQAMGLCNGLVVGAAGSPGWAVGEEIEATWL